jgi:hypothetical protein
MKDFINKFERQSDGSWVCVSFAEITTVMGRIQVTEGTRFMPGTVFMAVDIVRLLEQEGESKDHGKPAPERFSHLESKP